MIMEDHIMEDSPVETDQQDDVYLDLAMTTTDTIKKALWTLKTSQRVKIHVSWIKKVKLSSDEYHQFVLLLNEDKENHTKEKSRYNYRPHLSQLTIKLSGMVHDIFTSELCSAISNWVEWIATTSPEPMASIFERVAFKGCSEIKKLRLGSYFGTQDPNSSALVKHSPDAAFWMGGSSYPTIVIESFYYNDPATMAELAREYIVGSNGHIKVVVGFDLFESEEKQSPTVSVWRGKVTRTSNGMQRLEFSQTVIEKPFRKPDGFAIPGSLVLQAEDFVNRDVCTQNFDNARFEIYYGNLARLLTEAEDSFAKALAADKDEEPDMDSLVELERENRLLFLDK